MTTYLRSVFVPALLAGLLAGCAVGPDYHRPSVELPATFKEAWLSPEAARRWKAAQPSDAMTRGEWWAIFNDPELDALQAQALEANQDLKGAAARVAQARALQRGASSERLPQVDAGFGVTRQRASNVAQGLSPDAPNPPVTVWRAQTGISYEADLFGRVASTVDAATADAQQSEALFQSVQLALQADVAQAYFLIRQLDAEQDLYRRTVDLRGKTLELVERRYAQGDIGELDVARANVEELLSTNRAAGTSSRLKCAT
jgi:multidrug efflux system outer membrane protein